MLCMPSLPSFCFYTSSTQPAGIGSRCSDKYAMPASHTKLLPSSTCSVAFWRSMGTLERRRREEAAASTARICIR